MSLKDARRMLQWNIVMEALADAGVDADIVKLVESARAVDEAVHLMAQALIGGADAKQAKNYIKVEMVGLIPPFDRAYIELVRPGGKTSHELREMLRDRLERVRQMIDDSEIIKEIDDGLALEAP